MLNSTTIWLAVYAAPLCTCECWVVKQPQRLQEGDAGKVHRFTQCSCEALSRQIDSVDAPLGVAVEVGPGLLTTGLSTLPLRVLKA